MPLLDFDALARHLPGPWASTVLGQVGPARIKVLRMDAQAYPQETHDYDEGLLVISGCLRLDIGGAVVEVGPGNLYLVPAGQAHGVLAGSHGTLVIVDV